ncbi:MAG: serine hydrolase domain-containing protein, partial [Pseudomonadota bacterium]
GILPETLTTQGEFVYSNLGYGLLGQLLAAVAGQRYEALLYQRVLEPLGLGTIAYGPAAADSDRLVQGFHKGRAASHWSLDAYAPAGGLVASVNQMLDFIQANLDPQLPFVIEAQQPRGGSADASPRTLGLGYAHRQIGGQIWRWHNGGTGGFRSYFGFAPERDFGIVILTNGTGNSDALAASLIRVDAEPLAAYQRSWFGLLMSAMGIVFAPLMLLAALFAKPKPPKEGRRLPDRLDLIVLLAGAAMMLVVSRATGEWISVPYSLWWLGLVVSVAAAGALLRAQFLQRKGFSGGRWGVFGRGLIVLLYGLIILALI